MARSYAAGRAEMTASTSASVVVRPRVRRSALRAACSPSPIARTTCDGSGTPAWHAEPVETAMPARIQQQEQRVALRAGEDQRGRDRAGARPAAPRRAASGIALAQTRLEAVAQCRDARRLVRQLRDREFGGDGERGRAGGILGPRAQTALLSPAVQERLDPRLPRDDQGADPDGPAELVRGDAERHEAGAARA